MRRTLPIYAVLLSLTLPNVYSDTKEDSKELAAKQKKAADQKAEATRLIAAVAEETDEAAKKKARTKAAASLEAAQDQWTEVREFVGEKWKGYPRFIDRKQNPEQYAARARAEIAYIKAQLEVANCLYLSARIAESDKGRDESLELAAKQYEEIHQKYRSMVGGLSARLWMARCYQEQDNIRSALGITNEILAHPSRLSVLQLLQDQALQIRLTCLNHPKRRDYQLVMAEGKEWIVDVEDKREASQAGQAIRWELARAHELHAQAPSTPDAERTRLLCEALGIAKSLKKTKGPLQKQADAKVTELEKQLGL